MNSFNLLLRSLGSKLERNKNTEISINLEQAIFSEGEDNEYTTRITKTVKGARALIEVGFEFVTDMDGYKLFRKRK
jgi:plastocyanin domain-containing protein